MSSDDPSFHWSEGMQFASDGIKLSFYLNGAACISILTFIGNTGIENPSLIIAMICFGLGALWPSVSFWFAYETQLQYGNERDKSKNCEDREIHGRLARKYHMRTRYFAGASLVCFAFGLGFSMMGFLSNPANQSHEAMIWLASGAMSG